MKRAAVTTHITPAKVVDEKENNIRRLGVEAKCDEGN